MMIAVIGCVKETINVKLEPPKEPEQQGMGAGFGAAPGGYGMPGAFGGIGMPPDDVEEEYADDEIAARSSGCGYNIAAYLAAWGYEVELISAIGDDDMGRAAKAGMDKNGIGSGGVAVFPEVTAVDVNLINIFGDVTMAHRNRSVLKNITPELLESRKEILDRAEAIVIDGIVPRSAIEYIMKEYGKRDDVKVFFDPAEQSGGRKVRELLDGFHCIMPGRMEAEAMSGRTVLSEEQLSEAGAFFGESGVKKVVITIKGGGLYYREGEKEGVLRPERVISLYSTSGAGDVVSAAVIAGTVDGKSLKDAAADAMEKAALYLANVGGAEVK